MKPGGTFLQNTFSVAGLESVQEFFTGVGQAGYDAGVFNEDTTVGEVLQSGIYDAALGALVGG